MLQISGSTRRECPNPRAATRGGSWHCKSAITMLLAAACLQSTQSWVQPLNCSQVFDPAHLGTLRYDVCAAVTRSHWRSQGREALQLG